MVYSTTSLEETILKTVTTEIIENNGPKTKCEYNSREKSVSSLNSNAASDT